MAPAKTGKFTAPLFMLANLPNRDGAPAKRMGLCGKLARLALYESLANSEPRGSKRPKSKGWREGDQ